jgi:hypothetical protein
MKSVAPLELREVRGPFVVSLLQSQWHHFLKFGACSTGNPGENWSACAPFGMREMAACKSDAMTSVVIIQPVTTRTPCFFYSILVSSV